MKPGTRVIDAQVMMYKPYGQTEPRVSRIATLSQETVNFTTPRNKRPKPKRLTPQFGTRNTYLKRIGHTTQIGEYGRKDYQFGEWGELSSFETTEGEFGRLIEVERLVDVNNVELMIENKIREELLSAKSQLGVDLAELRKTKKMLANAARDLFTFYRDLRAGRPFVTFVKEMRKTGVKNTLSSRWLEYIYGWTPLIKGAYETAEVLNEELINGKIITGKVRAPRQKIIKQIDDSYGTFDVYVDCKGSGTYEARVFDPKLLQFSKLGFTNPLSIAWELTPWSFVFDWFVDVGGYINRMDAAVGLSDIYFQTTVRRVAMVHGTWKIGAGTRKMSKPIQGTHTSVYCRRSEPRLGPRNTFKGIKKFTNETVRLTSAVALIQQQIGRIKKVRV